MSDRDIQKFIETSRKIKLSENEKSDIKQSIWSFIKNNPVRNEIRPRLTYGSNIFLTKLNFASAMAILLILTVLVGGGVAVGAERALPGDALYAIKVNFNEEVRALASVSEESKANWEIERVQRRLEEAETLAEEGSLDADVRAKIEANFESHSDRVKDRIEKFENKDNFNAAVDVSSKFEASLKAHQKILNRLTVETKDDVKKEVKPIETRVKSRVKALTEVREKIELRAGASIKADSDDDDSEDSEVETETELELNLENGTNRGSGRLKADLEL